MQPKEPLVAIFVNNKGIEAVKLIPTKPYVDVEPMKIYGKISDLVDQINSRLKEQQERKR
jgi:hypothetical protein